MEERADIESTLRERDAAREAGAITAAAGSAGFGSLTGSAADILRESKRNVEFDLRTIESQSSKEAEALRLGGSAAKKAGNIGFLSGGLSAASLLLGGPG